MKCYNRWAEGGVRVRIYEVDIRQLRRMEDKTQQWVGDRIGVPSTTIWSQEKDVNLVSFGRVKEILDLLGYDVVAIKREEE